MKRSRPLRRRPFRHKDSPEAQEAKAFSAAVLARANGVCERCGWRENVHAHHLCPRSRAVGHPLKHDPVNGAALCLVCHDDVHFHTPTDRDDWIKGRDWLDQQGETDE